MKKILGGVFAVIGLSVIHLLFSFLLAYPVMWMWNDLSTKLFYGQTMKQIDVTTAFEFMVLCSILFKNTSSSSSKG